MRKLILLSSLMLFGCVASSDQIKQLHDADLALHVRVVVIEKELDIETGEAPPPIEDPWWACMIPELIAAAGAMGIPFAGAIAGAIRKT